MIAEITKEIGAELAQQKIPATVVFGKDDGIEREIGEEPFVQVLYAGRDAYDVAGTVRGPTMGSASTKWVGVRVLLSGSSSKTGASEIDHKRAVEGLVDQFILALELVLEKRSNVWRQMSGTFLVPAPSVPGQEDMTEVGARYELVFQIGRSVLRKVAATAAADLVVKNVTTIDQGGTEESSCGGD